MKPVFLLSCALAALAPLIPRPYTSAAPSSGGGTPFVSWEGETFEVSHSAGEIPYVAGFPGQIRAARSARGHYLIREVTAPTRVLHSSYDCFLGSGYRVETPKVEQDRTGRAWSVFTARRGAEHLRVSEIFISAGGESWTDISSWYWNALFKRSQGPWQAITRVETVATEPQANR